MIIADELFLLRKEARKLRQDHATKTRSILLRDHRIEQLEIANSILKEKLKKYADKVAELAKENTDLKSQLGRVTDTAKKYAGMLFKSSVRRTASIAKRGARRGHTGFHRAAPSRVDTVVRVALTECSDCHSALKRTESIDTRIVEDVPLTKTIVTKYEIERQWCCLCHKEVRAVPKNTLPGCSLGLTVLTTIMFLKYRIRAPLAKIVELLEAQHELTITEGCIVNILNTFKIQFGTEYQRILTDIRHAPVKHADETSWRIEGVNSWAWLFSTPDAALYTIEENRGKGVPERILGPTPTGLLVRDDYSSYAALPMPQQSCWSHLLRVSREHTEKDTVSPAMKTLHAELGTLFVALKEITETTFVLKERLLAHRKFFKNITSIIGRTYAALDASAVQTRIKNQGKNLIEALLHEDAPLTNNHAERMIRPVVVTRKISGGSRSDQGAATHAVNMSIVQTLSLRGTDFFAGIRDLIHAGNPRYAAGNG